MAVVPSEVLIVEAAPPITGSLERALLRGGHRVIRMHGRTVLAGAFEGPLPESVLVIVQSYAQSALQVDVVDRVRRITGCRAAILALIPPGDDIAPDICLAADDFTLLPSTPSEVAMRLDAVRRRRGRSVPETAAPAASLHLDEDAFAVLVDGLPVELTFTEFELLKALYARRGKVVAREDLARAVWGYDQLNGSRVVDVHMWRLRTKLESGGARLMETVRNRGYRLL